MIHCYLLKERFNGDISLLAELLVEFGYEIKHMGKNVIYIKSNIELDNQLQLISIDSEIDINFTKISDEKGINDLVDVFSTCSDMQIYISENELYFRRLVSRIKYEDIEFLDFRDKFEELTLRIVRTYISRNFNVLKTAQELFVHRNTVNNNIKLFYEKTGLNPRDIKDAFIITTIFNH